MSDVRQCTICVLHIWYPWLVVSKSLNVLYTLFSYNTTYPTLNSKQSIDHKSSAGADPGFFEGGGGVMGVDGTDAARGCGGIPPRNMFFSN